MTLTPSERRGALVLLAIFALGAAHDLWETRRGAPEAPPGTARSWPSRAEPSPPVAGEGDPSAETGAAPAGPPAAPVDPIDLNRATAGELDALPGVGPVLAERIVAYRREHGAFRSVEELMAIRGVGPKSLARMQKRIRVPGVRDSASTPAAAAPGRPAARSPGSTRR